MRSKFSSTLKSTEKVDQLQNSFSWKGKHKLAHDLFKKAGSLIEVAHNEHRTRGQV
jgi:hypothetical protein